MGSLGASGAHTRHSLKIEMVSRRDPASVFALRPCLLAQGMGVQGTSRTSGQTLPLAPASRERQKARSDPHETLCLKFQIRRPRHPIRLLCPASQLRFNLLAHAGHQGHVPQLHRTALVPGISKSAVFPGLARPNFARASRLFFQPRMNYNP